LIVLGMEGDPDNLSRRGSCPVRAGYRLAGSGRRAQQRDTVTPGAFDQLREMTAVLDPEIQGREVRHD
jgi:hypothetical protein